MSTCMQNNIKTVPHASLLSDNFTQVPNEIIHNTKLSVGARFLLIYLLSRARIPNWTFYDSDLMEMSSCSSEKLKKLFKELRLSGYVKTVALRSSSSGKMCGKKRIFADSPIFIKKNNILVDSEDKKHLLNAEKNVNKNNGSTEGMKNRRSVKPTVGKPDVVITNIDLITNTDLLTNNNIHISSKAAEVLKSDNKQKISKVEAEEVFSKLWEQYPVKKGRKGAIEKFFRITRGITLSDLQNLSERIFRGLGAYILEKELCAEVLRQNPHLRYQIPPYKHGETWFNKECWDSDTYMTTYEEVFNDIVNRPENLNRRPSKADQFSRVFQS